MKRFLAVLISLTMGGVGTLAFADYSVHCKGTNGIQVKAVPSDDDNYLTIKVPADHISYDEVATYLNTETDGLHYVDIETTGKNVKLDVWWKSTGGFGSHPGDLTVNGNKYPVSCTVKTVPAT